MSDSSGDRNEIQYRLQLLESVFSSTPDCVYVFDRRGRYLYANEALREALTEIAGESPGEVIGRTLQEVGIPEEPARRYHNQVLAVVDSGEPVRRRASLELPDGSTGHFEYIFTPVIGEDGQVKAVAGITRDITELTEATEALAKSESLYRTLFESVEQGIGLLEVLDDEEPVDFRWLDVNDAFEKQSGLKEPVGKTARQLASNPDESWFQRYLQVVRTGEPMDFEGYITPTDRWVEVHAVPVAGPETRRVAVLFSDITARKRRESNIELLNEINDEFARLSASDEIMELVVRRVGQHLDASRVSIAHIDVSEDRMENVCAWSKEGIRPGEGFHRLSDFLDDEHLERLQQGRPVVVDDTDADPAMKKQVENYRAYSVQATVQVPHHNDGQLKFLLTVDHDRAYRWRDDEVELLEHITARLWWRLERAYAEERLREANRSKDRFLAVLSHELRNPLAPIDLSLHLLDETDPESPRWNRAREVIGRQVRQLTRLVDDLLDISRIERDKIRLERTRIDLSELTRRTVRDHRSLFDERGLELNLESSDEPVWVQGDWNRLSQVLGNLLQNAVKFTEPGGRATVKVGEDEKMAKLVAEDTGEGMTPETIETLFDPFFQADETLHHSVGGLGLGLPLAKELVELHGGEVTARSDGLGEGSTFTVRIPLDRSVYEQRQTSEGTDMEAQGRKILIIEDNVDAVELLQSVLELKGHRVEIETTGDAGLEKARQLKPDVVICDIGLPGMSGYEVAQQLRQEPGLESALLIAISGYARPEDREESEQAGFDHHLAKPPDLKALDQLLE